MKKICLEVYEYDNIPCDLALMLNENGTAKFVAMIPIRYIMMEIQ